MGSSPMDSKRDDTTDNPRLAERQTRARGWFETLRDDICAAFEALEDALPASAPHGARAAGRRSTFCLFVGPNNTWMPGTRPDMTR